MGGNDGDMFVVKLIHQFLSLSSIEIYIYGCLMLTPKNKSKRTCSVSFTF